MVKMNPSKLKIIKFTGLGCIVDAMAKEALATAFCLSTDATGIAIQPARLPDRKRQACAKGHFFVVLADKDHVFFEYQAKHTSEAVRSQASSAGSVQGVLRSSVAKVLDQPGLLLKFVARYQA